MGDHFAFSVFISVVITVRNEERNIGDLLDSLVTQEGPLEIIIVDAYSTDKTREIVESYMDRYDYVRYHLKGGTIGEGRNFGVENSAGEAVAFIDGDCIANTFWLKNLREELKHSRVVAGRTIQIGYHAFEDLERVELIYKGFDITFPTSNLAYDKALFQSIGGFDEWFITAEDIDLNLRGVEKGAKIVYRDDAVVYHRTRGSFYNFFKQSFWNGAGRKQLTMKHGRLWKNYRPGEMFRRKATFWSFSRLAMALLGYVGYKFLGWSRPED
jgi:glycosyltransferase involved in cell wall biosynthesis